VVAVQCMLVQLIANVFQAFVKAVFHLAVVVVGSLVEVIFVVVVGSLVVVVLLNCSFCLFIYLFVFVKLNALEKKKHVNLQIWM